MLNKNLIPFDKRGANITSGIRIGTPAVTTRGMKEPEMEAIAEMIDAVLCKPEDTELQRVTEQRVRDLCMRFPFYAGVYSL